MAYEFNPLLPDLLQKKQDAATPGDIDRLQGEIDALTSALGDKVPKIIDSITEIEIGEIGQKQNGSTAEMTEGGFYKRGSGIPTPQYVYSQALTAYSKYLSSYNHFQCLSLLTSGLLPSTSIQLSSTFYYHIETNVVVNGNNYSAHFFLFPPELGYHTSFSIPAVSLFYNQTGYLYDYVYYAAGTNVGVSPSSLKVPVKQDINGNLFVEIDGVTLLLTASVFRMFGSSSAQSVTQYTDFYWELSTGQYVAALEWRFHNSTQYWLCPVNQNNLMIDCVWDVVPPELNMWQHLTTQFDAYTMSYVDEPSIICIFDPTTVATAKQGGYADSALQTVTASGSGYLSLTASAKSGDAGAKTQAINGSLIVQPLATADNSRQGLAESSDVKTYIADTTATKTQGTKADTALQQVVHGTDGLYVTTTVMQKASNEQTIYTSLTLQDVETADDSNKGVAEASNVRKMFNIISAQSEAYGVMWDTANPSPQCLRIGNMYNHKTLPVQSGMIGGVMADDGTFTPFDNQSDWTQATQARDGSDGQVMIKIPQHWRRLAQYGTIREILISPVAMPGYVEIAARYCGAYEASIERSTGKLCSVNNATADFRGGDNTSAWDGTYRTLLNRPVTNLSQSEFLAAARLRAAGTAWNNLLYKICRNLYWLFVTEYATLNSQSDYNAALDANGFRQGGLGAGVTTWDGTSWDNFNSYNPFVPCGYLDEYGNQTAVKNFSLYNADSTLLKTFSVNSYRGIMLPSAHIWKHTADVLINVESGDGNSAVYVCDNPANYNSSSVENYKFVCNEMRTDSYVKEMYLGDNADIFAIAGGGNSTSYYCDQQWCGSLPSSGSSLRCWLFGGAAHYGSPAGLACASSSRDPGLRIRHLGSRLCFLP